MAAEIREAAPEGGGGSAEVDEWQQLLSAYLRTVGVNNLAMLESRRVDYLAKCLSSERVDMSRETSELKRLVAEMRENERAILERWELVLKITFRALARLTAIFSDRTKPIETPPASAAPPHWPEIWEGRIKTLLRIAPVSNPPTTAKAEPRGVPQVTITPPPPAAPPSLRSRAVTQFYVTTKSVGDASMLLYELPCLRFGVLPSIIPNCESLRRLIIILGVLCYLANTTDIQTLEWAKMVVGGSLRKSDTPGVEGKEEEDRLTTVWGGHIIYLCCSVKDLFNDRDDILQFIYTHLKQRWLKSIVETNPAQNFNLLQMISQSDYSKFLLADTFIEAHHHATYIGNRYIRHVYGLFLKQLLPIDPYAPTTIYLSLWSCLFDRMITSVCLCSKHDGNHQLDLKSHSLENDAIRLLNLLHLIRQAVHYSGEEESADSTIIRALTPERELYRAVQYCLHSDGNRPRGAFTRDLLTIFHATNLPSWFDHHNFLLWSSFTAAVLDIPYIPHYLSSHQKEFPGTHLSVLSLREYRHSLPSRTASTNQLMAIIGAFFNDPDMAARLSADCGVPPERTLIPEALVLALLQNCIVPRTS